MTSPARSFRLALSLALAGVVVGLATGCANYQLGTGAASIGGETIFIAPVKNTAAIPQAAAPVTRAVRAKFVSDGRVPLARSAAQSDLQLEIELVKYARDFTAVLPSDTALARKFELTLTAHCTLTNRRTGKILFTDREISSTRQIFVDGGQNPAEYQVLPQLAAQLAERISHAVLDVW